MYVASCHVCPSTLHRSPLLRKIPSDPLVDGRSFGFSPSPMSFARYLAEGRQQQRDRQTPPSPRTYPAGQTPSRYPRGYSYNFAESFPYEEHGAPDRIPRSACRCPGRCTCGAVKDGSANPCRKDRASRHGLFQGEDTPVGSGKIMTVAAPAATAAGTASTTGAPVVVPATPRAASVAKPLRKNSDWENLLGAVDLELRAQQRSLSPSVGGALRPSSMAYCTPLHLSVGGNHRGYATAQGTTTSSMETTEPKHKHHRRGGDAATGGGPAYSGSTADAACLLATLPQRMLDEIPATHSDGAAVSPTSAPTLVSPPNSMSPMPVRVQASGRRGPRGQSRFKGVCITRAGKWRAVIYIGRKQKYLGVFDSEYDAARAYDAAAVQHFAEGAKLNFPEGMQQQLQLAKAAAAAVAASADGIVSDKAPSPAGGGGSGGAAAPRSATPPPFESPSRTRGIKRSFGSGREDDDEWVREDGLWRR